VVCVGCGEENVFAPDVREVWVFTYQLADSIYKPGRHGP